MKGAVGDGDQEQLLTSSYVLPVVWQDWSLCPHVAFIRRVIRSCVAVDGLTCALTRAQKEQSLLVSSRSFQVSMMSEAEEKLSGTAVADLS